jgi:hypothetical protein
MNPQRGRFRPARSNNRVRTPRAGSSRESHESRSQNRGVVGQQPFSGLRGLNPSTDAVACPRATCTGKQGSLASTTATPDSGSQAPGLPTIPRCHDRA